MSIEAKKNDKNKLKTILEFLNLKPVFTRQIYLSGEENINLIGRCDKILIRENWSFNKLIQEALKEYELRHGPGNNSFPLDTFGINWTKARPVSKCGFKNCSKLSIGIGLFVPKHQTFGLCKEHFMLAQENTKNWANLKSPINDKETKITGTDQK